MAFTITTVMKSIFATTVIIFLFASGCAVGRQITQDSPLNNHDATIYPRITELPSSTANLPAHVIETMFTNTPVLEGTPTQTETPSSLVPTPTWTPIPTLAGDQVDTFVSELLYNNPECLLPCWLGVMPGVTTWEN